MSHLNDPHRLPRTVIPRRYDLSLEPHLDEATFDGSVSIAVDIAHATSEIVMNACELSVSAVSVNGEAATWSIHDETQRLVIACQPLIAESQATVDITFAGTLNDKLRGFYRSTFTDEAGKVHTIATTQMQSTDCRKAFPCFDEPDMKSVFAIDLTIPAGHLAIANGAEKGRETLANGKERVYFADSIPMSTYLVAFVVGPLEATAPVMVNGVALRTVHLPGKGHLADFSLKVGAFALNWFHHYYGIPYPGDKIDMVALPDFAAGAMENFGLITYREILLLVDPSTATQLELQRIANVVSHELAHMWFGDLVTMGWWNGIWLNEAFATFMETAATAAFAPEWDIWTSFSLDRSAAFAVDSLHNTRPVEFPVHAPDDAEGMFDVLTYEKGGSILRMLEQYIGEERFRAGVSHYLKKHSYQNTETNDLWDAIEEIVSRDGGELAPVRRLMDSFIWQPGYPLVSAGVRGNELVLQQCRFTFDNNPDATLWVVPIHVRIGNTDTKVLLEDDEITLPLTDPSAVVVVNAGGHGFYRVSYSNELRSRLSADAIASLNTIERYNLVDDAWNAVVAGNTSASDFIDLAQGFVNENELAVWQALAMGLRGVSRLVPDDVLPAFRSSVAAIASPALARLGWEPQANESDLTATLRGLLVSLVAVLGGDTAAQAKCREILAAADKQQIDPELVAAATNVVAATGDAKDYDGFLARFREPSTPQEQIRMLYALAEFDSPELMERTCNLAFSGEVKTQNAPFLLNLCMANRTQGELAWKHVREHWEEANEKFPINTIIRMVDSVKLLNTPLLQADVSSFFSEHPVPQAVKGLQQILERQKVNVDLREREAEALRAKLTN